MNETPEEVFVPTIEDGVPLKGSLSSVGVTVGRRATKWPFGNLEVGQSFLAPGRSITDVSGSASYWRRKYPDRKFVCRSVEGGVRVWRVQ